MRFQHGRVQVVAGPTVATFDEEVMPIAVATRHLDHPALAVVMRFTPSGDMYSLDVRAYVPVPGGTSDMPYLVLRPEPGPVLDATTIRALPIGEMARVARMAIAEAAAGGAENLRRSGLGAPEPWDSVVERFRAVRRPGRAGRPDRDYAALAQRYVELITAAATVGDLADEMNLSESTVRNQLVEARKRGLLTAPPRGRAGGELTERARALLESGDV